MLVVEFESDLQYIAIDDGVPAAGADKLGLALTAAPKGSGRILSAAGWEPAPGVVPVLPLPINSLEIHPHTGAITDEEKVELRNALQMCWRMATVAAARPSQFKMRIRFDLGDGSAQLNPWAEPGPEDDKLLVYLASNPNPSLFRCQLRKVTSDGAAAVAPLEEVEESVSAARLP